MDLLDRVQVRFSTQQLKNLTNPQAPGPTSVDMVRLANACEDVKADIQTYCGVVYDDADSRHVSVACACVQERLRMYTGLVVADEAMARTIKWLEALAKVTGRDRILPITTSQLEPTGDIGNPPRPYFDRTFFDTLAPDAPGESKPYTSP